MTRILPLALTATMLVISSSPASAQVFRRGGLGRLISGAVERKVDAKVQEEINALADKMVDQTFDALFTSDSASSIGGKKLFSLLPNAPTESEYDFDVVMSYEIESTDAKGMAGDKARMLMNFSREHPYMGARFIPERKEKGDGEVFVIFDMKNESMVMLMESDGTKFSMAYGWRDAGHYLKEAAAQEGPTQAPGDLTVNNVSFTRIGSRKIAGYEAEGYRTTNEDGTVDVWVSRDPKIRFGGLMGATSSMKQFRGIPSHYPTGMMLEVVATDKDGEKSRITATKVDTDANVRIDMADYPKAGQQK